MIGDFCGSVIERRVGEEHDWRLFYGAVIERQEDNNDDHYGCTRQSVVSLP